MPCAAARAWSSRQPPGSHWQCRISSACFARRAALHRCVSCTCECSMSVRTQCLAPPDYQKDACHSMPHLEACRQLLHAPSLFHTSSRQLCWRKSALQDWRQAPQGAGSGAGTAISVAPLLGSAPFVDQAHRRWLHLHVRPHARGLAKTVRVRTRSVVTHLTFVERDACTTAASGRALVRSCMLVCNTLLPADCMLSMILSIGRN